jgi:hypothetical protein
MGVNKPLFKGDCLNQNNYENYKVFTYSKPYHLYTHAVTEESRTISPAWEIRNIEFPRWNYLLMGTVQIVNHLDKFITMSNGKCTPKVIIRVAVGSEYPVDPQCQHKGNFSESFRGMLKNIEVIELNEANEIVPAYEKALNRTDGVSTILVEFADYAKTK